MAFRISNSSQATGHLEVVNTLYHVPDQTVCSEGCAPWYLLGASDSSWRFRTVWQHPSAAELRPAGSVMCSWTKRLQENRRL